MNPPHDAQYYFSKDTTWLYNEEDDWLPELPDGADVFLKESSGKLYWWNPKIAKYDRWVETDKSLDAVACYQNNNFGCGPVLKKVISSETMAEIAVKVGQIFRDYDIECRYNEDFNYLQYTLTRNFFDEWRSQPAVYPPGAYEYWEAVHTKLGITRPHS